MPTIIDAKFEYAEDRVSQAWLDEQARKAEIAAYRAWWRKERMRLDALHARVEIVE